MNIRRNLFRVSSAGVLVVYLGIVFTTVVIAAPPFNLFDQRSNTNASNEGRPSPRPTRSPHPSFSPRPSKSPGFQACQAREASIKTRAGNLLQLVTLMESRFDAIATRVEDYYTSKLVPAGTIVPNYSALLADIQTKKGAVQTALTKAQTDLTSFSCTSGDPKAALMLFNTDMKAVKSALQDFKTSVQNLIVAVRSAKGQDNSASPNDLHSPKPLFFQDNGRGNNGNGGGNK